MLKRTLGRKRVEVRSERGKFHTEALHNLISSSNTEGDYVKKNKMGKSDRMHFTNKKSIHEFSQNAPRKR
jgi:hypothetical protein